MKPLCSVIKTIFFKEFNRNCKYLKKNYNKYKHMNLIDITGSG